MELREHSFLKRFPDDLARELEAGSTVVDHSDGSILFNEADPSDAVYLVISGLVELSKDGASGSPVIATVSPGGYFGEIGILSRTSRIAKAVCRGPATRIARIERESFLAVMQRAPTNCVLDLITKLGDNLREMDERYVRDVLRKERLSLIGEMANKVIHDFKGPFTAISMGVEMIERLHTDPRTLKYCEVMNRNLMLMQQMMQEILDFTSGNPVVRREPVQLATILEHLVTDNEPWMKERNASIEVHGGDVTLQADAGRIRRALQNLVLNAVEAFSRGKGNRIVISVTAQGQWVEILFEDDGPGLPTKLGAGVFDPFVSSGKKGGTGLGLSIAKGIVEAHGGSMTLGVGKYCQGAAFRIRIPLEAAVSAEAGCAESLTLRKT